MPGVTKYLQYTPHPTNEHRAQEDAVRRELDARVKRISRNQQYYDGDHKKHLDDDGTNTDDNVVINVYGLVVDKGVSDLAGTSEQGVINGPKFDVANDQITVLPVERRGSAFVRPQPDKTEDQQWLDAVWEANNRELFLHNMAVTSGIGGHSFIKIIPDALPNPADPGRSLPRLVLLNPCHITVFWDEGDKDKVLAYRIQYGREGYAKRQELIWQDATEDQNKGWLIVDWEQQKGNRTWIQVDSNLWEYDWPPIVQWQNLPDPNDFYGCEDVEDANRALNDSLNFVSSNIQRIIKYHADPKGVATGVKASDDLQKQAANRMMAIENSDAKVYNIEMQSDLKSSMDFAKMVRRAFFDGVRELDPATVEDRLGDLTNFGLRVLFGDKTKKTGTKRMMAGMGLIDICQRVLELGGYGERRKVAIKWPEILPDDPTVQTQALDMDTKHGLSQEGYLTERGYDVELEAMRRKREQAESTLNAVTLRQGAKVDALRNGVVNNAR